MERGPLPSGVYDLIKGSHRDIAEWSKYFLVEDYELILEHDPGMDDLNDAELNILKDVARDHRHRDEFELSHWTHSLPEWLKNDPGKSSKPISLSDILEALGKPDREQAVRSLVLQKERARDFLSKHTA
jgi:hypothetical protein